MLNHFFFLSIQRISYDFHSEFSIENKYRTRDIITRGLCIFNPLFEVQKQFFKEDF